jgi:hypothetical protein
MAKELRPEKGEKNDGTLLSSLVVVLMGFLIIFYLVCNSY